MFTPQEVSEKSFPKASFGGYQMAAVDDFLDGLTEDYTTLYKENATLKAKLKVLAEKVEEYRATEEAMRSTLLAAQRMAAQMVQDAQTEKEQMLVEARRENEDELKRMKNETEELHQRLALAQQELGDFVRRSRELCEQQAEFFRRLPEMDMGLLQDSKNDVVGETAEAIEDAIAESYAEQSQPEEPQQEEPQAQEVQEEAPHTEEPAPEQSAPVEEPVAEPAAEESEPAQESVSEAPAAEPEHEEETESTIKVPPFPTLDLDELKFGRNYGNEK